MTIVYNKEYDLYVPSYESRLMDPGFFEKTFRSLKRDTSLVIRNAPDKRVCIQAGGYLGIWPNHLSHHFDTVYTFEPNPVLFNCLVRNTSKNTNISCIKSALGNNNDSQEFFQAHKSGADTLSPNVSGTYTKSYLVNMIRIDDLVIDNVDAIILDIERSEVNALKGAARTIERCRPIIQVEAHDKTKESIGDYLTSIH